MFLYISICFILLICMLVSLYNDKFVYSFNYNVYNYKKRLVDQKIVLIIMFIFLWILTAFRGKSIGNDTHSYIELFYTFCERGIDFSSRYEIGFQLLCIISGKIAYNPQLAIVLSATVFYFLSYKYISKYSYNNIYSLILFFCFCFSMGTNTIRQCIAIVICLYAYQSIKNGKKLKGFFLIILGSLFHNTALICLLLFLERFTPKKKLLVYVISLFIILLSISGLFLGVFSRLLPEYSAYFGGKYEGTGFVAVSYAVIRNSILVFLFYKYSSNDSKIERLNVVLLLLISSFGFAINLFTRASEYFLIIAIVDVSNLFYSNKMNKSSNRNFIAFSFMFLMIMYFIVVLIYKPEWNNLYPYVFWS